MNERIVNSIKYICSLVIISIAPEWTQRNMLAEALLIENLQRRGLSTPEHDARALEIVSVWGRISAVRTRSNELEAEYIAAGHELSAEDCETIKAALVAAGE